MMVMILMMIRMMMMMMMMMIMIMMMDTISTRLIVAFTSFSYSTNAN